MLKTLIVSPEDTLYNGTAISISAPGVNGEFMIYPQHCPLLSTLTEGTITINISDTDAEFIYLESGTISVRNNHIKICADIAFKAREVEEAKILKKKRQVQSQLDQQLSAMNTQALLTQLSKLNAQLNAIEKLRKFKKRI
ncbi:ATP synthase F1 subunit epsilon [Gammaproteobacteria bacterium]|nr:ATP synthase F1 subunit epsilon [Gammaproteobacteria bacterium]